MKQFLAGITFFFLLSLGTQAQQLQTSSQHRIQAKAGLSWVGIITNVADNLNVVEEVSVNATPVFDLSYEYFYSPNISLGVAVAYQAIGISYEDYAYEENGNTITRDFSTELTRLNFSVKASYWYNPQSKAKFYSGLRLGLSNWSADTNVADPTYDPDRFINVVLGAAFAPQLVLIGTDIGLDANWQLGGELAIGAPYFMAAGVSYRW
ncbi:MAG: outer membrane beta-barrel protein [Cyclobacteriaceae bacterium]